MLKFCHESEARSARRAELGDAAAWLQGRQVGVSLDGVQLTFRDAH